jgi:hypothetical protein
MRHREREPVYAAGATLMRRFLTRDSVLWTLGLAIAVGMELGGHTSLVSPVHAEQLKDWAAVLGAVCTYLKNSPLPFFQE